MITIEKIRTYGWTEAIRGMRNPMNSWDLMDSWSACDTPCLCDEDFDEYKQDGVIPKLAEWPETCPCTSSCDPQAAFYIGKNDLSLMKRLRNAGIDHRKYLRMIVVYMDITAPLYWWKEFDTYKVGTVANSCSTMHKIHAKQFSVDDFSREYMWEDDIEHPQTQLVGTEDNPVYLDDAEILIYTVGMLNELRELYIKTKDKRYWYKMIQLLPSSYNQKRTVMLNYEVLNNMYKSRKNHKLDEWRQFCKVAETLPYAQYLITSTDLLITAKDVITAKE